MNTTPSPRPSSLVAPIIFAAVMLAISMLLSQSKKPVHDEKMELSPLVLAP